MVREEDRIIENAQTNCKKMLKISDSRKCDNFENFYNHPPPHPQPVLKIFQMSNLILQLDYSDLTAEWLTSSGHY